MLIKQLGEPSWPLSVLLTLPLAAFRALMKANAPCSSFSSFRRQIALQWWYILYKNGMAHRHNNNFSHLVLYFYVFKSSVLLVYIVYNEGFRDWLSAFLSWRIPVNVHTALGEIQAVLIYVTSVHIDWQWFWQVRKGYKYRCDKKARLRLISIHP